MRIKFTSSLNEISTDQLGNRVGGERGEALLRPSLFTAGFWTDIQRRQEGFITHLGDLLHS
jgi:hypothetical protein